MDRPEDIVRDPAGHAISFRYDPRPWCGGWRAECSCGWRSGWGDRRDEAEHEAAVHQTRPEGERGCG